MVFNYWSSWLVGGMSHVSFNSWKLSPASVLRWNFIFGRREHCNRNEVVFLFGGLELFWLSLSTFFVFPLISCIVRNPFSRTVLAMNSVTEFENLGFWESRLLITVDKIWTPKAHPCSIKGFFDIQNVKIGPAVYVGPSNEKIPDKSKDGFTFLPPTYIEVATDTILSKMAW